MLYAALIQFIRFIQFIRPQIYGVRPEEAFEFPPDPAWFTAVLLAVEELVKAKTVRDRLAQTAAQREGAS